VSVVPGAVATRRLLDRFGFGPRAGDLPAATERGFAATLDAMLASAPDAGVAATPPPALAPIPNTGKAGSAAKKAEQEFRAQGQNALTRWWLDRMWAAEAPLSERLTWFWHGHFATSAQKVNEPAIPVSIGSVCGIRRPPLASTRDDPDEEAPATGPRDPRADAQTHLSKPAIPRARP
jgi:hypothetical protein